MLGASAAGGLVRISLPPLLSLVVALALVSPSARAWGPLGHRTIGAIADRLLTPQAHAAVAALLARDVDRDGDPSHRATLEAVSDWADEIRGTPASHPRWHYDNAPLCRRAAKSTYCPDGECNTEQLKRLVRVLADPRASLSERNAALKWVVHLTEDIHQPLHAADNDDHGGNAVRVVLEGVRTRRPLNLHGVWDNELVQRALDTPNRRRPPADIDALAAEAERALRTQGEGTPDSWAAESRRLARTVAYHYPSFRCDRRADATILLDLKYQAVAETVIRERLLIAGARLASLLNGIFAAYPDAAATAR